MNSKWVSVSSTSKVSDDWIIDLGFNLPPTPKTDWCLGLMINSTIIRNRHHMLKLYLKKKKK